MEDERRSVEERARAAVRQAIADVLEGMPGALRECRTAFAWRQVLRAWLKRDGAGELSNQVLAAVCELGDRAWNDARERERDERTRAAVEAALAELSRARQDGQAEERAAAAQVAESAHLWAMV